jgi:hypothetical protein
MPTHCVHECDVCGALVTHLGVCETDGEPSRCRLCEIEVNDDE